LNRPDAANAINLQMALELMHASIRASDDPAIRAGIPRSESMPSK
jgi:enoyl-CoA hydratase/carnithine racemase